MKIVKTVISSGHGKHIRGAAGPSPWGLDEVNEARKVVEQVATVMRGMSVDVITYHDDISTSQSENLGRIVDFHNSKSRDLDVSVHFNAYQTTTSKPMGVEVLYVTQEALARTVCDAIVAATGLPNRGPKYRGDLAFLNNTEKPSLLIETLFCDAKPDCDTYRQRFAAICTAIAEGLAGQQAEVPPPEAERPPPTEPPATGRRTLGKGDNGPDVIELQKKLGVLIADGDFGSITDTWVRAFQAAVGTSVDGVVGPKTWEEVDALQARVDEGEPPLPKPLADAIYTMAQQSEIADFAWPDRGVPPPGYIAGMASCFAVALRAAEAGDAAAKVMTKELGNTDVDGLAWYRTELTSKGLRLDSWDGRLRALFTLLTGLGPRESSGKYCEGRDMSASNVQSETCEASLFQTSWNIKAGHPSIAPLLPKYWDNPNGFLTVFKDGISPSANNLNSYGSGDGVRYQFLSRFCPLFHVMVTGVGMRTLRQHWGPIGRREVTINPDCDKLLKQVQALVEDVA